MNKFYAKIVYLIERERYTGHEDLYNESFNLLHLIWKYNKKVKLLVGGDHHLYADSLVCFNKTCIPQIIASGLTKGSTTGSEFKLVFLQFFLTHYFNWFSDNRWKLSVSKLFAYKNYAVINCNSENVTYYGVTDISF